MISRQAATSTSVGCLSTVPFGQSISGNSSRSTPSGRTSARPRPVVGGVEYLDGVAAPDEKVPNAAQPRALGIADEDGAGAGGGDHPDPAQDQRTHHHFAVLGQADHQRAEVRRVEGQRQRAGRTRVGGLDLRRRQRRIGLRGPGRGGGGGEAEGSCDPAAASVPGQRSAAAR